MKTISEVEATHIPNQKLRDRRASSGMSIKEVSDHIGISQYSYLRAECGRTMRVSDAVAIAKFFETTVEDLWAAQAQEGRGE